MLTGDESTVVIHHMEEQPSSPGGGGSGGDGRRPVSVFGWIGGAAKGVGRAFFHTLTGPAAGPVLFACICAALVYSRMRRGEKHRVLHRSLSIAALHGGDTALERILDAQKARLQKDALENAAAADGIRHMLGGEPKGISYKDLHRFAAKLEMSGKEDDAINMLQQAVTDAKDKKQPHEAHELEMLLVEMLIYKGEYEKALKCKCLEDEVISDARGPLYKAIIYHIKGDGKSAEESYKKFREIRGRFHSPDSLMEGSPLYGVVHNFDKFKKVVDHLKEEIVHAKAEKP